MKTLILFFALCFAFAHSVEFITMQPSTVSQIASVRNAAAWANINNVLGAADTRYASASVGNNGVSQTIRTTNFQFNVPANAIIEGIQVIWSKGSQVTGFNDSDISLVLANTTVNTTNKCAVVGSNVCGSWVANGTTSFRDDSYGGQNDLWGLPLTPAEVNDAGFGASLQVKRVGSSVRSAYVESVKMTVFYSVPIVPPTVGPTVTPTPSTPATQAVNPTQQQQVTQPATQPATPPTQQPSADPSAFTQSATEPGASFDPIVNSAHGRPAGLWLCAVMVVCFMLLL